MGLENAFFSSPPSSLRSQLGTRLTFDIQITEPGTTEVDTVSFQIATSEDIYPTR